MLLAQVSRTLDSSHGFDSSGKGNRELCESECTPDGPIAATSSEEIATKRASKKHETTQVAQSQRKERTPVDFELIEKSIKAAVVGVRVTTQHLLLQQLLASLPVIDNGTAAARGMLAPRTGHRNRNQAATTSASDRQKTSQWKRAGKNRSDVSDARRPRAVEPVAGAATTVGSSSVTFSSLLYAHVTAMAAIWRLLRGLGATDDTFKRPSLKLSRTNQSHGGQLKSYRSRTQPLPNVGEMKRAQSWGLLTLGTLLSVQCDPPTMLAFTTSAEDLALLTSSEAAFAAAIDAELMSAASSRDYDSVENMRGTLEPDFGNGFGLGYGDRPAVSNNYDYGSGQGGDNDSPKGPYGASIQGSYTEDHEYGRKNEIGHDEAGHQRNDGEKGGYGRHMAGRSHIQRHTFNSHRPTRERSYERNYRPQRLRASGQYPRQEYSKESGFTYEKVYPEKIMSRSYKKDYRRPHNGNHPVEWRSGRDQSYGYSNRAEKNYTPRPIFRDYSFNYKRNISGNGGDRGRDYRGKKGGKSVGHHRYGSSSVKTYDYVDPKAGSRTRLVELVKGPGARGLMEKYLQQPDGIERYMNDFRNGASSL
ncbi:uncharacterized protein LOC111259487 [Varroa jacobsoni]|uniref:uncharacterized protein LOC111259487 n=1 Tax=Varroa jacobsoni TaxID=62625 RepID=UPI000BF6C375|nr:uncharacterized protein LOC111259487 [Varroa jacobsoni]